MSNHSIVQLFLIVFPTKPPKLYQPPYELTVWIELQEVIDWMRPFFLCNTVAIARFGTKIDPELATTLRDLGFRWNRFLKQWEGKVDFANAKTVVEGMGGNVQKVNASQEK